ncbi:12398_t:CDS:2, partial [Racocetra fulgida]
PVRDVEHCKIVPVCDIKYDELKDLKYAWKGGFSDVYEGIWEGRHIAAKFVRRETPTELKDFDHPSLRPEISKILNNLKSFNEKPICTEKDIPSTELKSITWDSILPLIKEARQVKSFYSSYRYDDNIQLNKRMCNKLGGCIIEAVSKVEMLQNQVNYDDYDDLLAWDYYDIKSFIENISQIRGLKSYIQDTDSGISLEQLKDKYIKLLEEFHESTSSLGFNIQKDNKIDDIHRDIEETKKGGSMYSFIDKIIVDIQNTASNKLFENEIIQELYDNGKVAKIEYKPRDMERFFVQIAFLKNLKGLVNISKFYGGIKHDNQIEIFIECILITSDLKAKITNFYHSRLVTDESGKLHVKTSQNDTMSIVSNELNVILYS